jgi:hypothetical protein
MHPNLYVGIIIDQTETPGKCICRGKIVCSGKRSRITIDRNGVLEITEGGKVIIQNDAILQSTHNDHICLIINGELIIDDMKQIATLNTENVIFGPKGKLIVRNPEKEERRILFETPDGIQSSDLYRIFLDKIDHIEFHISKNTGIRIDHYYEFFNRDLVKWFGNRRIEKAIYDGILVWHDGGYIEFDKDIIPWVNEYCNLLDISDVFKTFGKTKQEKLQDLSNRLRYAKSGNIHFRFVYGDYSHEVPLILDDIKLMNFYYNYPSAKYCLSTNNNGFLFLQNNVKNISKENLIQSSSKKIIIADHKSEFIL